VIYVLNQKELNFPSSISKTSHKTCRDDPTFIKDHEIARVKQRGEITEDAGMQLLVR
jgi:hypothetical protein